MPYYLLITFDMKTILHTLIFIFTMASLYSCHTTSETTSTDNRQLSAPMQEPSEQEFVPPSEEQIQRSGLAYDEIQKLNTYAEEKGKLVCQMSQLVKDSEQALSQAAAEEYKQSIIALDQKLISLGQEIDTYCNTETRQKYFYHALKQYTSGCE